MREKTFDVAVVGGGIVGTATAMALLRRRPLALVVLEKERRLAAHQTGNNSGVIHSGLYYRPGSLKARNCTAGREALYAFCAERGIPFERCGKVVVATGEEQLPVLEELRRRGEANGLAGLAPPAARGDPRDRAARGGDRRAVRAADRDRRLHPGHRGLRRGGAAPGRRGRARRAGTADRAGCATAWCWRPARGEVRCRYLVNCAGLQSDRVARMAGAEPGCGSSRSAASTTSWCPERHDLVRNLIYPVPDPEFPFLGVHFTRKIDGGVEAGPNAVLAFKREGYTRWSFSARDLLDALGSGGFWRMAASYWRMGVGEFWRSWNKRAFVRALQALMPEITVRRPGPGRRRRARPGARSGRNARGRLPDRRGGAADPRAQRPLAGGHRLDRHRREHRRPGRQELRPHRGPGRLAKHAFLIYLGHSRATVTDMMVGS